MSALQSPGLIEAAILSINRGTEWASGDNVTVYSENPEGSKANLKDGSSGFPVTSAAPTLKVSQTQAVTGGLSGDGAMGMGAIFGASNGTAASKVQGVGVVGTAKNAGTEGEPDACGVYGVGRVTASGKGRAFGGFLAGRRDGSEGRATGLECYVENGGGADSYDITNGPETTKGVYIHSGTAKIACGVQVTSIAETENPSVDVAFAVNKFAAATAGYQDNSSAERSIQIKGTHSKAALSVAAGSGPLIVGNEERNASGEALLEVYYGETALDPGVVFGTGKGVACSITAIRNSTGNLKAFAANAANQFVTGSAQGDTGIACTAGKTLHLGAQGKTSMVRVNETGAGFFGHAPAAQPTGVAETAAAIITALKGIGIFG